MMMFIIIVMISIVKEINIIKSIVKEIVIIKKIVIINYEMFNN
jgi:hypothetical protein